MSNKNILMITINNKIKYYTLEYNDLIIDILTNVDLLSVNKNKFKKYINQLKKNGFLKYIKYVKENKPSYIINFDTNEIKQESNYVFDGFYIPTMFFEIRDNINSSNYLIWKLLEKNLKANTLNKEIHFYYVENGNFIDGYINCYNLETIDFIDLIKNYRKIEDSPNLILKYGIELNTHIYDREINLVKFVFQPKNWKTVIKHIK